MEFEQSKNDHHFEYFVEYPEDFIPENYTIPPMLIQPFVENAIKHGLLLQEKRGTLWLKFNEENGQMICRIEDDGVGIAEAMHLQKQTFVTHTSLGSKIVRERVDLLNELGYGIEIKTSPRTPNGTIVEIRLRD
jgi:sensor histidine kinase YesM